MPSPHKKSLVALEKARKAGNEDEVERLKEEVRKNQKSCPHPAHKTLAATITQDSPTHSKYRAGDTLAWCTVCNAVLGHAPGVERGGAGFLRDLNRLRKGRALSLQVSNGFIPIKSVLHEVLAGLQSTDDMGAALNQEVQTLLENLQKIAALS